MVEVGINTALPISKTIEVFKVIFFSFRSI